MGGLQIWLPLNGNLNNQGLSNVTVTNNGGNPSYESGKIGQGLSTTGGKYWTISGITLGNEATIACWTKTTINAKMSWVLGANVYASLNLFESSIYTLNTGDSNNNPFQNNGTSISVLHDGLWHHFAVTFGNNKAILYIDGLYAGTAKTFKSPACTNSVIKLAGGFGDAHTYDWNGMLNDFRVYDYALSAKEVKELSKGLVSHYKLDSPNEIGKINKYSGNRSDGEFSSYTETFTKSKLTDERGWKYTCSYTGTGTNKWISLSMPVYSFTAGKKYYYSMKVRCNNSIAASLYLRSARIANDYGSASVKICSPSLADGKWHEYYTAATVNETTTLGGNTVNSSPRLEVFSDNLSVSGTVYEFDFDVKDVQVVEATEYQPFIDNGFSSNVVHDSSGYGNNGTSTSGLLMSSNCPRYNNSTYFDNSSYISLTAPYKTGTTLNEFTTCVWFKTNTLNNTTPNILSFGANSFWRIRINNSTTIWHYINVNGTNAAPVYTVNKTLTDDIWHYWASTFKDGIIKSYIDGELIGSSNYSNLGTVLTMGNSTWLISQGFSEKFIGNMSDVRVYSTALSDDDIKELYNTSAFISDNGTLGAFEFDENNGIVDISSMGIVESQNVYENGTTVTPSEMTITGSANGYSQTPINANNACSGSYDIKVNDLSVTRKYVIELDFTWTGTWGFSGGTGNFNFQGANKPTTGTSYVWSGTNYISSALNSKQRLYQLVTATPNGGTYHYKTTFTIPANNDYNGFLLGTRCDYSDGHGSFSYNNLKIYPYETSLDSEQTKFGDTYITCNNLIEM